MGYDSQVDRKGLFLLAPEEGYFTHDKLQIKRIQFPVFDASVRIVYSAQGDEYDACVIDLARPHQMSAEVFYLASYVMISRAKSLDGLLITRLCEKAELERGAPQYLVDEVDRLLTLELQSQSALKAYLQKVLTKLPSDILALFSGSDTVPHKLEGTSSATQVVGTLGVGSVQLRLNEPPDEAGRKRSQSIPTQQQQNEKVVRRRLTSKSSPSLEQVAHVDDPCKIPQQVQHSEPVTTANNILHTPSPEVCTGESPASQAPVPWPSVDVAEQLQYSSTIGRIEDNVTAALHNVGNTCYLNSMLHVFARVPVLCDWFAQHAARWGEVHQGLGCPLCLIASDVHRLCVDVQAEPFEPRLVRARALWSKGTFDDFAQHDVTEAIELLLDSMNSVDLQSMTRLDPDFNKRPVDDASMFTTPMWKALQMQYTNCMHCHACNHESNRPERLKTLPLHLPEHPQQIEDLVANQWGEQPLKDGDDPYRCPNVPPCGRDANVSRTVVPEQWPKVLVLTLKRWKTFLQDDEMIMRKILTHVDFQPLLLVPGNHPPYHLLGVIEHHGAAAGGGHYTSYVRAQDNFWYYCNDEKSPQRVSVDTVLHAQAYVLVYQA